MTFVEIIETSGGAKLRRKAYLTLLGFVYTGVVLFSAARFSGWPYAAWRGTIVDFNDFYLAGVLAAGGRVNSAYAFINLLAEQRSLFGEMSMMPWTYPPQFDLLLGPLARLPIGIAYTLFISATLGAYTLTIRRLAPGQVASVLMLIAPAIVVTVRCGQNGFLTGALMIRRVQGAMLLGIAGTTIAGVLAGVIRWSPQPYSVRALSGTFLKLDVPAALRLGLLEIVFVFLFVDLFDNIGTLVAVGKRAGLFNSDGKIPRLNGILTADALATTAGSLLGTSTVVSYIESAAGVAAGGRSGVTAIVTGLLFLAALFVAPIAGVIPVQATAPALILVGALMLTHAGEIEWADPLQAIPAFLTMTAIPLTFSIANGLAFGFLSYTLLKLIAGQGRKIHWLVYLLAALCAARFFYLGKG